MEDLITKYAILIRKSELRLHCPEVPLDDSEGQILEMSAGTLLKIFKLHNTLGSPGSSSKKWSTVKIVDFVDSLPMYENLYDCPQANLRKISEDLWPFVISISKYEHRLRLISDENFYKWIIYLKPNDLVSVRGDFFGKSAVRFDCIIRYIGPVQELYPVGYFFGLELLHLDGGYSPQSEDIPFSIKYIKCDPSLSIFTTADWISPLPNDAKKKFSALGLITETLGKFRSAIGPSGCASAPASGLTLSKSKRKEPTAQFYDSPIPSEKRDMPLKDSGLQESDTQVDMDTRSPAQNRDTDEVDRKPLVSLEDDEYQQSIANYEKSLERQHTNAQGLTGILKHRRNLSSGSSGGPSKDVTKPTTIMSLDDRDIIVIDKADIRESTKSESSVIVVDKLQQQSVDLADLLGGNWPNSAGEAATILNKTKEKQQDTQQLQQQQQQQQQQHNATGSGGESSNSSVMSASQAKSERNKSPNPLSHFNAPRSVERNQPVVCDNFKMETNFVPHTNSNATTEFTNSHGAPVYDNIVNSERPATHGSSKMDFTEDSPLQEVGNTGLGVGSMVEVCLPEVSGDLYGVIRWIGVPPGAKQVMVGVELEEDCSNKQILTTNGTFNGVPLFKCHEGRALFVTGDNCSQDRRFLDVGHADGEKSSANHQANSKMFGQVDCPSVAGAVPPLKIFNIEELEEICGKFKGIQGHHNSCYLDATLFAMFTFTSVFDSLLFRPPEPEDIVSYVEVQKVLREEIVNPLRKNVFVRADRVMKLRQLLDKLSSVSGLTSEEKDPEEFLNSLLAQIMRVEPFLKLSSGQDAYFYQLFVEKDERLSFPTVQQLFEQSFHASDIKLKEVPSCLIIQMPRFGKNYKMYPRILPSQVLDVTDIIEDSPRQCSVCGKLAEYECGDCFGILQGGMGLESTAFCLKCLDTVHMHAKRANHTSKKLSIPQDFRIMAEHTTVPRLYMELFAVVCIETSHYVAFVKASSGPDAPWCFFDSMADRKGERNGYNIPEMITVPDLPQWLSEEGARAVNETSSNDKMLPEHAKRLFCDAYMCMYQSTDVMMYR